MSKTILRSQSRDEIAGIEFETGDVESCEAFSLDNLEALQAAQQIIWYEEERVLTLDETLSRVLQFYQKFVPYT
jgi:hypothetical protein